MAGPAPGSDTQVSNADAVLFGGPYDGATIESKGAGLVELDLAGTMHRYVPTATQRTTPEGRCTVYTYDGVAMPHAPPKGAQARSTGEAADDREPI